MSKQMNEWMNNHINICMMKINEWMSAWIKEWINELLNALNN